MNQSEVFDTIVIGLGAMGSSTAYYLSQKGKKVLGLEQYSCAHSLGSSHGETRLIRQAYFEHPDYVPLLKESYTLWSDLEKKSKKELLHQTGVVIFGDPQKSLVLRGVRESANQFQIPLQEWSSAQAMRKHPGLIIPDHFQGLFESTGGYLEVEKCVQTFCEEAQKNGAKLCFEEPLLKFEKTSQGFKFTTSKGSYFSEKCVFTCGAWTAKWVPESQKHLRVHRAPLFWFSAPETFKKERGVPCFAFDLEEGFFYGFTAKEGLLKVALHQPLGEVLDPSSEKREVKKEEGDRVRDFVGTYLKEVVPEAKKSELCFYTMSSDQHFILDELHGFPGAFWAGGFSGHGFKFSSLIGKALSEWVVSGQTSYSMDFLSLERFAS